jgi:hypothetical protein
LRQYFKDRIGDGSSGKKKVEIAKVSPTPVSAPVEIKLEPVAEPVAPEPVAPEPVAELLQSEEMQAFDPIRKYFKILALIIF